MRWTRKGRWWGGVVGTGAVRTGVVGTGVVRAGLAVATGLGLGCAPGADPPPSGPPSDPPAPLATLLAPVIYGADDRLDDYQIADPAWQARLRQSAVALVPRGNVSVAEDGRTVTLSGEIYGEHFDLCPGQAFFDQIRAARCSGTLIAPDLVLTAGHCVPGLNRCNDRRFVFDWRMEDAATPAALTTDAVYRCAEILVTRDDDRFGQRLDFAVVRLDRPVGPERAPAPLAPGDEALAPGKAVNLLGFPNGLPAKFAPNGAVVAARADRLDYFEATVDAFGGNSGSGVYTADGRVVGVLVRGATDYVSTPEGCDVVNVLPEAPPAGEGAEDVTYVARALEGLCATGFAHATLCPPGAGAHCRPCEGAADCAPGFACAAYPEAPTVRVCAAACGDDGDCRPDHRCAADRCLPRVEPGCGGGDVVLRSACGPEVRTTQVCAGGARCAEAGCVPAPPGDRCEDAVRIEPVDQRLVGDLAAAGHSALEQARCGGEGPEVVYAFGTTGPVDFEAVASGFDTVLSLRRGCDGPELACVDDSTPPGQRGSRVAVEALPAGDYRLILDAYDDDVAPFTLDLTFGAAPCEGACVPETGRCLDAATQARCVADDLGCGQEAAPEACAPDQICADGRCRALAPDAGPPDAEVADTGLADAAVDAAPGGDGAVVGPADGGAGDADSGGTDARPGDGAATDARPRADGADPDRRDRGVGEGGPGDLGLPGDAAASDGAEGVADAAPDRRRGAGGCTLSAGARRGPPGAPASGEVALLGLLLLARRARRRRPTEPGRPAG